MTIEYRKAPVEIDGIEDEPIYTARAVAYDIVDSYGTRFRKGVFNERLGQEQITICWAHDSADPIGSVIETYEQKDGFYIRFRLDDIPEVPSAQRARAQLNRKTLQDVSVGFDRLRDERQDDGVVDIINAELVEVSLVMRGGVKGSKVLALRSAGQKMVPADAVATIIARLGAQTIDLKEALEELEQVAIEGKAEEKEIEQTASDEKQLANNPEIDDQLDAKMQALIDEGLELAGGIY
jgi:HK97 family phage prohead protease